MVKSKKFSLRFSILTIFVALVTILMTIILSLTTFTAEKSMLVFSKDLMDQVAVSIDLELSNKLNPSQFASELSAKLISDKNLAIDDINELQDYTYNLLLSLPQSEKAYYGDQKGNFVISRFEDDRTISTETILRDSNQRYYIYRNAQGEIIDTKTVEGIDYDPRDRPWYQLTQDEQQTVWSDVYFFYSGKYPIGVTVSSPVFINGEFSGVFGVDVSITQLSTFLENLPISENATLFITNTENQVIAMPGIDKLISESQKLVDIQSINNPSALKAYHLVKKKGKNYFSYNFDGEEYIAQFQKLKQFESYGWLIGIIIPESFFIGEIQKGYYYTLILCVSVLIIGIILITIVSKTITRPLLKIVEELKSIADFDLSETPPVQSRILEVSYMASTIPVMKQGLRSFQKFIPEKLVRKLIRYGRGTELGGRSQNTAILFTDIRDFTNIAEKMDPEPLTTQLCEYFDELSQIIADDFGTIDKYIGDSIMAFWGAPVHDDKLSLHACQAVLDCKEKVDFLNKKWKSQGKPEFYTRFGLHRGVALIGNVGSSERINYTVIGDTVNAASRLESINKVYHTQIIVSETIYEDVKDVMQLRLLDQIAVKGKTEPLRIYELMSSSHDENIENYNNIFIKGFEAYQSQEWESAIKEFNAALELWPDDFIAQMYMTRCQYLKGSPPGKEWDGVWQFDTKG